MTAIGSRATGQLIKVVVAAGGTGYTAPPTVTVNGVSGLAYAQMGGTAVSSVAILANATGYTSSPTIGFSGGGGTGAAATAYAYTGTRRPMTFFKGRNNDMYGVDGMGRGIRWNGDSASVEVIGVGKPNRSPTVTASSSTAAGIIASVQMVTGGAGYSSVPSVVFTGGTPTRPATAVAKVVNGRVSAVTIKDPGAGYQATPVVSFTGGMASSASFDVGVVGSVDSVSIVASGSGYTTDEVIGPGIAFSSGQGLTLVNARVGVEGGHVTRINLLAAGTGATTSGVTAEIVSIDGSGAALDVKMRYRVAAVTVANSGVGHYTPPIVSVQAASDDKGGGGAALTASVDTEGHITGVTVVAGGAYSSIPTVLVRDSTAKAQASLTQPLRGVYQCCIRYVDATPESQGGPIPSSISELVEIDAGDGSGGLTWTFNHAGVEDRVAAMELWRTTADQSVVLFRVATIKRDAAEWSGTYSEGLPDSMLTDYTREGYGMMPVTLPSGQVNARRFEPPPGEFAVACMFQDRAWYAVDTLGLRPNALMYSEVDEPESVPPEYELVLQENTGSPDKIVALIPYASMLLVVQQAHLYKLTYVAQPVLDASMLLAAYRGILNPRCWDVLDSVIFIADSYGLYAFDGNNADSVSVPVDNFWRDGRIDFSKADQFHLHADNASKTIRFYYCTDTDSAPAHALCYNALTKAWWTESYPTAVTATCHAFVTGKAMNVSGLANGGLVKSAGRSDLGQDIPYSIRTGPLTLANERGSRSVTLVYKPTSTASPIDLKLHYNGSDSPRPAAVQSNTGAGFVTEAAGPAATLDMQAARSPLGDATGTAKASFSGRVSDDSAGADRYVAIALEGSQAAANDVCLYGVKVEGADA